MNLAVNGIHNISKEMSLLQPIRKFHYLNEKFIEYIVESRESLQKFICGVVIGVDDNLFLGAVRAAAKLVQVVKDELPEDNYSFMLGKVITDVMFISYFEEKANKETEKALIFTSIALASAEAGALLFVPTAGVSEVIAIPITMRSIQIAIKSLVVGALAEAGAMHSQSLLNDDQSKLKEAKRDKGAGNLKFKEGYDKHIIDVEDIVRKKNKGVVGGHNFDNFKQAFKDKGWNVDECIIGIKEHPTVDGIYEVEYRLPALNNKGEIISEQYKNIPNPKTVFDPSKISNEDILEWGKQAMEEGMKNSRIINGREIEGYAKNGLKFKGYIDGETGEITNFFPTLN